MFYNNSSHSAGPDRGQVPVSHWRLIVSDRYLSPVRKTAAYLPAEGEDDVVDIVGGSEERGDFFVGEAGNATANTSNEEGVLGVLAGKLDEFIDIGLDGFNAALHGGNAVTLALQTNTLAPDGAKLLISNVSCAATMGTS